MEEGKYPIMNLLPSEEDLSTEQMIALLKDAEQRLRAKKSNALERRSALDKAQPTRLQAQNLPKPYVSTKSGVAKLDRARVRSEEDHRLAGSVKKVEDPVVLKEKRLKVGYRILQNVLMSMRKLIPKSYLDVDVAAPL